MFTRAIAGMPRQVENLSFGLSKMFIGNFFRRMLRILLRLIANFIAENLLSFVVETAYS